jgi:hypothetical protein
MTMDDPGFTAGADDVAWSEGSGRHAPRQCRRRSRCSGLQNRRPALVVLKNLRSASP